MSYLLRQSLLAALTANALRPMRGYTPAIPSFVLGWLTSELAPQLLALNAADTGVQLARGRRSAAGLTLAAGSAAGLGYLVAGSRRSQQQLEDALTQGLGVDYVEQLDAPPTPADLATPWRSLARPFRFGDDTVRVERDIAYTDAGSRGHLDIYLPAATTRLVKAPVLLQVHGGAWTLGRKDQQGLPLMHHLAARGWICVAINYRLAPRDPFPAQIIDVKRAIAWIKQHISEYGGDPDYLVVTGGSAGGHLSALAALTPGDPAFQPGFEEQDTSVQAAVPVYGVYDFAGATGLKSAQLMRDRFLAPKVMFKTWQDSPADFENASPILRITPDAPDFFVIHGTHDTLVDVDQARLFVGELHRVSQRSVVYAELPGTQHAFDVFHSIRSAHMVRAVSRYLNWHWNRYRAGQPVEAA